MTDVANPTRGASTLGGVVIRFAGDSGDGMQLVGDRFTELSAAFGNDLATLPNFPAEIRAPAGTIAGVSSFQVHISDHDIVTPGDTPNVLVAMNPAALKANLRDLSPGSTLARERRHVRPAQPRQGRLRAEPARRRLARELPRVRGADDLDHGRGDQAARREAARRGALEELLRARPDLLDVHAADRAAVRLDQGSLREPARRCSKRTSPRSAPA